jgi:hypothetical protein
LSIQVIPLDSEDEGNGEEKWCRQDGDGELKPYAAETMLNSDEIPDLESKPEVVTLSDVNAHPFHPDGNQRSPLLPSNLYLPGKVMGKPLHFLVNTGCTNSLLLKPVFDRLPAPVKKELKPRHLDALLVDGTMAKMYGEIQLPLKIRHL